MNLRYAILEAVSKNPSASRDEIADVIDYERQKVKFAVGDCVKIGLLSRRLDDVTKKPGYVLTPKGRERLKAGPQKINPKNAQPAVASSNTGSNGSGTPSEHHLLTEAVAVQPQPATEALASLPPEPSVAADVTDEDDDDAMPDPDPALLTLANLALADRLDGVAHALRGSGLPGLAEVTGDEDLQSHVAALAGAYQMTLAGRGAVGATIDHAAELLAEVVEGGDIEPCEMDLEELAERAAEELRNAREFIVRLHKDLQYRTDSLSTACAALGKIGERLDVDPDEGGAGPILDAIEKLVSAHHNQAALSHKLETLLTSKTHECEALRRQFVKLPTDNVKTGSGTVDDIVAGLVAIGRAVRATERNRT